MCVQSTTILCLAEWCCCSEHSGYWLICAANQQVDCYMLYENRHMLATHLRHWPLLLFVRVARGARWHAMCLRPFQDAAMAAFISQLHGRLVVVFSFFRAVSSYQPSSAITHHEKSAASRSFTLTPKARLRTCGCLRWFRGRRCMAFDPCPFHFHAGIAMLNWAMLHWSGGSW